MVCLKPIFASIAFLLVGVLALPTPDYREHDHKITDYKEQGHNDDCLTDSEARFLVDTFNYLLIRFDPSLANEYIVPDFHAYSDSYITFFLNGRVSLISSAWASVQKLEKRLILFKKPLGSPVAASREEFIQNHSLQDSPYPGVSPNWFLIEDIFHTCTKISFRWALPPAGQLATRPDVLYIRGNDIMHTVKQDGKWMISAELSEFNTYAWAQNVNICSVG